MKPYVVGIAGGSGSGKTTLCRKLQRYYKEQSDIIFHDNYYCDLSTVSFKERIKTNYDHPQSLETSLLVEDLKELKQGKEVAIPTYNFVTHLRSQNTILVQPKALILVDGILILENQQLRELLDLKVFIDTDADVRLGRRLRRDTKERGRSYQSVLIQYFKTVKPMHEQFVEPSKMFADIIIRDKINFIDKFQRLLSIIEINLQNNESL